MFIAGEPSGDALAAELVAALRERVLEMTSRPTGDVQPRRTALSPVFFGAGGRRMAEAGVDLVVDMTRYSVIGVSDVLRRLGTFGQLFRQLLQVARQRQPDVIVGVDYGAFNLRFARAVRRYARRYHDWFHPWHPKLVQYVSPQVWASRPGRARLLEQTHDLVLCLFPFEQEWYAARAPRLHVVCVGHPLADRLAGSTGETGVRACQQQAARPPCVVVLPGSRADEVRRHGPVLLGAFSAMQRARPELRGTAVLPNADLARAVSRAGVPPGLEVAVGDAFGALAGADVALAKSGTVTLECALRGVPTVVVYRTAWPTYWLAKGMVQVRHLAMPNLLAGEEVFPEFVQAAATASNVARAGLELLQNQERREVIRGTLARVAAALGPPGASQRAAEAIVGLLD